VPDGTYVGRLSPDNMLRAGYRPFDENRMQVDRPVRKRWVLPEDAELMKSCVA
jgi:hypothetical protein